MTALFTALSKIPTTNRPLNFRLTGPLVDSKHTQISQRINAPYSVLRGIAILLQNVDISLLNSTDLEAFSGLNYHLLDASVPTSYRPRSLNPSTPYFDTLEGRVRSKIPTDKNQEAYLYSLGTINMQEVSLYQLVTVLQ